MNHGPDETDEPPSKSERKRRSDDLQALGEGLIDLPDSDLDALPLPEQLRDAVLLARKITQHGGLYRQKQYIGKLMRKVDAEPIRAALEAKRDRQRIEALRFRRLEQWRDRLLAEGTPALESLRAEVPGIDAAALTTLAGLIERARKEQQQTDRSSGAARELFRVLRDAIATIRA
jgi:ribosome-associated protein